MTDDCCATQNWVSVTLNFSHLGELIQVHVRCQYQYMPYLTLLVPRHDGSPLSYIPVCTRYIINTWC